MVPPAFLGFHWLLWPLPMQYSLPRLTTTRTTLTKWTQSGGPPWFSLAAVLAVQPLCPITIRTILHKWTQTWWPPLAFTQLSLWFCPLRFHLTVSIMDSAYLMCILSEYFYHCISDPGFYLRCFNAVNSKPVTTFTLRVFNKYCLNTVRKSQILTQFWHFLPWWKHAKWHNYHFFIV
jgi:hypothetical protein